jgi:hypothetical protein
MHGLHMVNPDFDKLNAKIRELNAQGINVGSEVTDDNIKKLFESHKKRGRKNTPIITSMEVSAVPFLLLERCSAMQLFIGQYY